MEKAVKEMSWRDETLADANMRLKFLDSEIATLSQERADIISVLEVLECRKSSQEEKPAQAPKPRSEAKPEVERVEFELYGRKHSLRKPVVETLLHLQTFCTAKVVAQCKKWHKLKTSSSARTTAKFYIKYLLDNDFIEEIKSKGHKKRYRVIPGRTQSLAALVEGL